MSAAEALHAARIVGVRVRVDGDDLVLEASAPPSPDVVDALSHHKAGIIRLLRTPMGERPAEDRQNLPPPAPGAPFGWAQGIALLEAKPPPQDVPSNRWTQLIDDCRRFLNDGWAAGAAALGWTAADLFGCDRQKPSARLDRAGLLWLLAGRKLVALTADAAVMEGETGAWLTHRRIAADPSAITLAWAFGTDDAQASEQWK